MVGWNDILMIIPGISFPQRTQTGEPSITVITARGRSARSQIRKV